MESFKVGIIGGGIFGVSLAYHLAKEGWNDVCVIEKGELTSGSTWHAAGQCPHFIGDLSMAHIHYYGTQLYPALAEETGAPIGWHECGGIRLALTDEEVRWFKYVEGIAKLVGYEMHIISPEEIAQHHPFLNVEGVKAGALTIHDGHVDPSSITNAMANIAKKLGVTFKKYTTVQNITRNHSHEWVIHTDKGDMAVEHAVNAAGCYSAQIAAMVGAHVPIANMTHQYIITEGHPDIAALDKELPVIRDPYSASYLRQERDGILVGPYETAGAEISFADNNGIPPLSFDMDLFEPELDRLLPWLERATERFPLFAEAGIKRVISGPITHTPDGNFLLGPTYNTPNFWMACGASIGISQGGGAGKYLAQWMVHGDAEINMRPVDPRRFGAWATQDYTNQKSVDDYQHMYYLHCPGEHREAGRPLYQDSLYDIYHDKGAVFADIWGWERAKWFNPHKNGEQYSFTYNNATPYVKEESLAVRDNAGIINMSAFTKIQVTGPDAYDFLNYVTANKLPQKNGRITLTHALSTNGRYISEFTITRHAHDNFMLISGTGDHDRDLDNLHAHSANYNVTINDVTKNIGVLVVVGKHARDIMQQLSNTALDNANFTWLSAQNIAIQGIDVTAVRVNYVGELGWELYCNASQLTNLYKALFSAGSQYNIRDFGTYATNGLRLEKSYRGMGSELTNELTPIEANMERFVDYSKDFVGKDAVLKVKEQGPKITLVMLELSPSDSDAAGNEPIYHNDSLVGLTTSGGYGYRTQKSLAFAYIDPQYKAVGTTFTIPILSNDRTAVIIDESPYDSKNTRLRS